MSLRHTVRRAAGAPARRFFDQRFNRVEQRVDVLGERSGTDVAQLRDELLRELDSRLERVSFELAAATRGHLESMSYVAVELARIESGLTGMIEALRTDMLAALAGDRGFAVHAFAVRALAGVSSDARILVSGPDTELAARALSALGHEVEGDLESDGPFDAMVLSSAGDGGTNGRRDIGSVAQLLAPGGVAVLAVAADDATAPSELEIVDRATASDGVTLLAARRR